MEKSLQKLNQCEKRQLWSERVAACRNSGTSVRQWCQENGVSEKTYYYWQRRLFEETKIAAEPVFAEVVLPRNCDATVAAVIRAGSFQVEIQNGADTPTLQAIFRALTSC